MILHHDKHLHIDEQDPVADWLVRCIKSAQSGTINLEIGSQSTVKIDIINNGSKIMVDLLEPTFFSTTHDETGLFDKLKSTKEFAKKLTDHDITISFLRKGKEAITIGSDAQPTLSKLITRSDDVQVNSVTQATNLKRDFKVD
jgi:hypothetical protein